MAVLVDWEQLHFHSKDEINKQKANQRQEKLICGVTFLKHIPFLAGTFVNCFPNSPRWLPILLAPPEVGSLTEKVERIPTETTLGCGKNGSSCCCTAFWCRLVPKFMEWKVGENDWDDNPVLA